MAKHGFGKFLLVTSTVAAAAIGAYYYLQSKDETSDGDLSDDDYDDDFDDFDNSTDTAAVKSHNRTYVDLKKEAGSEKGEFKEGIHASAAKTDDKIVGDTKNSAEDTAGPAADDIQNTADKLSDEIEDFFDDEKDDNDSKS